MTYYEVNFPNHTTLVMKVDFTPAGLLQLFETKKAVRHSSGAIYNLKQYQSFRELSDPDDRQKLCALGIESVM